MSKFTKKVDDSNSGEGFKIPTGSYGSRLAAVIDLGTQKKYQSEDTSPQVFLVFEMPDDTDPKGRPFRIGKKTTFSVGKKANLRKWFGGDKRDGDELDITEKLGEPMLINVEMKDGNSKLTGIGPLPKGMNVSDLTVDPFARHITDDTPIPEWVPWCYGKPVDKVIKQSIEKGGTGGGEEAEEAEEGDTGSPF